MVFNPFPPGGGAAFLILHATGIALGVAVAVVATRTLSSSLFEVEPFELSTYLGVSVSMALVGLTASYVPAMRASSVDPMVSLRVE